MTSDPWPHDEPIELMDPDLLRGWVAMLDAHAADSPTTNTPAAS
jgi:hypothetical protein